MVAQELPDKGVGALEKPTGADLYISITDSGYCGLFRCGYRSFGIIISKRYVNGPVLVEWETVSPFTGEFQI